MKEEWAATMVWRGMIIAITYTGDLWISRRAPDGDYYWSRIYQVELS